MKSVCVHLVKDVLRRMTSCRMTGGQMVLKKLLRTPEHRELKGLSMLLLTHHVALVCSIQAGVVAAERA